MNRFLILFVFLSFTVIITLCQRETYLYELLEVD
jgi:hypothetical protein